VSGSAYQVEAAVVDAVAASVGPADQERMPKALETAGAVTADLLHPGRYRLDLRAATVLQLEQEGIESGRISTCPLCTVGEPLLFHSWRRDQVKAVQWSGIVSQAP
jgi:copper oxidase (laccase) domain-containing protein